MKTGAPVIIGSAAKVVGTAAGTATAGLLISTGYKKSIEGYN